MKKTVLLFQSAVDVDKWQNLLRHFGVRVLVLDGEANLLAQCRKQREGFLIAGGGLLAECPSVHATLADWVADGGGVVVTGSAPGVTFPFACEYFSEYFDPLTINALLLRYLPDYSRSQPRMEISLPGLCLVADQYHFCEVLSLGPSGAYIKAGIVPPQKDSLVRIHVPLLGMRKEMELEGRVVRQVIPHETNNYTQGFGICFEQVAAEMLTDLHTYIRHVICDLDTLPPFNTVFSPGSNLESSGQRLVFSW